MSESLIVNAMNSEMIQNFEVKLLWLRNVIWEGVTMVTASALGAKQNIPN